MLRSVVLLSRQPPDRIDSGQETPSHAPEERPTRQLRVQIAADAQLLDTVTEVQPLVDLYISLGRICSKSAAKTLEWVAM